jgi:hypothetical protein
MNREEIPIQSFVAIVIFTQVGYRVTMTANGAFVATCHHKLDLNGEMFTMTFGSGTGSL